VLGGAKSIFCKVPADVGGWGIACCGWSWSRLSRAQVWVIFVAWELGFEKVPQLALVGNMVGGLACVGSTVLLLYPFSDFKTIDSEDNRGHNILGIRSQLKKELGLYHIQTINMNY